MDSRYIARLIGLGRIGIGLSLLAAPTLLGRLVGAPPTGRTRLLIRLIGVRDLVLGAGAVGALGDGSPAAPWVRAGAAADAVDAAALLLAADEVGPATALGGVAVAAAAATVGWRAAADVDA